MSHNELVEIGYKWLDTRCGVVFKELTSLGPFREIPDVIGFISEGSFLLEAKTSRSDFFNDTKKRFRMKPHHGMGDWRFIICEKGIIEKGEVILMPGTWGLIEVNEKGKAKMRFNPFGKGNIYSNWERNEKNQVAEIQLMYSALRRLHKKGLTEKIYNNPNHTYI
jgi:hypothetical protein